VGTGTAGGRKPSTCARRLFHNQVFFIIESKLACLEQLGWLTTLFTKELDLTNNQVLQRIQMSSCCRFEATEMGASGSTVLPIEGAEAAARDRLGD